MNNGSYRHNYFYKTLRVYLQDTIQGRNREQSVAYD